MKEPIKQSFATAVVTALGSRSQMEDAHSLSTRIIGGVRYLLVVVCDGHNGDQASTYTAKQLPQFFWEAFRFSHSAEDALRVAFKRTHEAMPWAEELGTAVTTCLVSRNRLLWVAYVGDCRTVVTDKNGKVSLTTEDHRVWNSPEVARVKSSKRGVIIERYLRIQLPNGETGMGLMMTRALGDRGFDGTGISHEPEIRQYLIQPNDYWLIVACDGLWDVVPNKRVAEIGSHYQQSHWFSQKLLQAYQRRGSDNFTAAVVKLNS